MAMPEGREGEHGWVRDRAQRAAPEARQTEASRNCGPLAASDSLFPPFLPPSLLTRQIRHHRLKVQEALQPTLGNFGLVGSVGRVPPRILQHVAQNHARRGCGERRKEGGEGGREDEASSCRVMKKRDEKYPK